MSALTSKDHDDNAANVERTLGMLPVEAVETLADLAGEKRDRVERVIQLLGLGSRSIMIVLGLVTEVSKGAEVGRLRVTDKLWPVMAAAALAQQGFDPIRSSQEVLSEIDEAIDLIEKQSAVRSDMEDRDVIRTAAEEIPSLERSGTSGESGAAACLRGIVERVEQGGAPYTLIEVNDTAALGDQSVVALSSRDESGEVLAAGEEVTFRLEAVSTGGAVAVDIRRPRRQRPADG